MLRVEEEMMDCSVHVVSDKDWHWKKPNEVVRLRKKKRSSTLDKMSKENSATSLAIKEAPPLIKPNPFRTKRSEIKSLEKGSRESVLYQEVLLKVRAFNNRRKCVYKIMLWVGQDRAAACTAACKRGMVYIFQIVKLLLCARV